MLYALIPLLFPPPLVYLILHFNLSQICEGKLIVICAKEVGIGKAWADKC